MAGKKVRGGYILQSEKVSAKDPNK